MNEKIIENFLSLCAIPHKSHHEEKISRFLCDWAVKKGLAAVRDEEGNVIIDKAGSAGHENAPRTILQAHMDMVVVWEDGMDFDPLNDTITVINDGKTLKAKGNNTICPDYPQPGWFYDLCDELGLYVIDCANINAPEKRDDRKVGGTPSNDPSLADEYLERVKAMYYRSRNHSCVIAFALGGESGNGYNMYKAYEWLKSVEKSRPVICADADGEWNSDL